MILDADLDSSEFFYEEIYDLFWKALARSGARRRRLDYRSSVKFIVFPNDALIEPEATMK